MRVEGRSSDCEHSSEKRDIKRNTSARRARKMYDRLHLPRQTGATPTSDVASASEFPIAAAVASERDDVEPVILYLTGGRHVHV